jgi:hypothetical protein
MRLALSSVLLLSIAVLTLAACQRGAPPDVAGRPVPASIAAPASAAAAPASAASAVALGATEDSPEALMQEAFPDWNGLRPYVMTVPEDDPRNGRARVATSPELVVEIDASHRALVVSGMRSNEVGENDAAHSQGGNLGVYWFTLREGRWFRTGAQESVLWSGSNGQLGTVKAVTLGAAHPAVAVEGGWCGQGACASGLYIVEIGAKDTRLVAPNLPLLTDTLGVAMGCEELLEGKTAVAPAQREALSPDNCFDVHGQWHVEPAPGAERADIVIAYAGHDLVQDPATHATSVREIDETVVYRFDGKRYARVSGRDPTRSI